MKITGSGLGTRDSGLGNIRDSGLGKTSERRFSEHRVPNTESRALRVTSHGFTLIELILTVVVISVGLLGILLLFENASRGSAEADRAVVAANLAHEKLEGIVFDKAMNGYAALSESSYPVESFTGDLSSFTRATFIAEASGSDFVTASPGSGYKRVDVRVIWGAHPSQRLTISTVLSDW